MAPQILSVQQPRTGVPVGQVVNLVPVFFLVTDSQGKFQKDLKQDQFKILDNNHSPQKIISFESQTTAPLRVGLLIDASTSNRDRFLFLQQSSEQFLHSIIRPGTDKAFVLAFDEVQEITQEFTGDQEKLKSGIRAIRPGGGRATWDAVYYACRNKMMTEQTDSLVRRTIILFSEGDDQGSRVLRREAIEMAQRAEVIVYAIITSLSSVQDDGDRNLEALADATGGRAFHPHDLNELSTNLHEIQEELRSQYLLSYRPDDFVANGQFHSVEIVPENKKLRVRAAKGYFAPKR